MSHLLKTHHGGWTPDRPDHRDLIFNQLDRVDSAHKVPVSAGITPDKLPPIWDQLAIGSCTAHGALRAFLAEAIKEGLSLPMLSRLFEYWATRSEEGTTDSDAGASVRDAIRALGVYGCCPESEWPYDISQFAIRPPDSAFASAKQHMAFQYKRITLGPGAPLRTALASGYAIDFGFSVPASFEDGSWDPASGEPLPLPGPSEGYIGGHSVAATFYDWSQKFTSGPAGSFRTPPFFTCDNSWGGGWGMAGRFNIHADYFGRGIASDAWIIQRDN